jgi:hydrogenase maturation protein HypF
MKTVPSARLKLAVQGAVQGVGFRPFIHRLAAEHHLTGWVLNSSQGVLIEAEGPRLELEKFLKRLETENPPRASIQNLEANWLDTAGYRGFEIRPSETSGRKTTLVLPDLATCPDCLSEIFDPTDRRYLYPFTNCTHCGPRFSIIESLPYDRANTSMKNFAMCPRCIREYNDPGNRRFHAQPNACPHCGPRLELWDNRANISAAPSPVAIEHAALLAAAEAIRKGQIIAVKGVGGFHLMVDARNDEAVRRLRLRKHREEKPFALLFPSLDSARTVSEISTLEERVLLSTEAPIVLLKKSGQADTIIASLVAPANPNLGVILPSNPLHYLLMDELKFPVVATSGNLSDEPICINEREALECLRPIADVFLVHNRPIVRHVDDSIVRVVLEREMILRRARGYAPLPLQITNSKSETKSCLAVGGHLKNSVAMAVGGRVFISQHIGDLETEKANEAFRRVIRDFQNLYEVKPEIVAADLHPDYLSTKFAATMPVQQWRVQHHVAHVLSCMADNEIEGPALGISWDGTGCGADGTIWGGEFFHVDGEKAERIGHLRPFPLPGGDAAIREPRRAMIGLLYETFGVTAFDLTQLPVFDSLSATELRASKEILQRRLCSPLTTSVGRLFDAVASLIGLRHVNHYEGQAAMELEFAIGEKITDELYPLAIVSRELTFKLDWRPMVEAICKDINDRVCVSQITAKFHNAMAQAIVEVAKRICEPRVVLSGGCFQNRYLLERTVTRLREENFLPFWHRRVPPNDGGIALGQIVAARKRIRLITAGEKT